MSEKNVGVAREIVEAWNTGGLDALLKFCPEDVVWCPFAEWPDGAEPRRGHAGVRELMAAWIDNFDGYQVEIQEIRDLDNRVLVRGEMTGLAKGTGVPIRQPLGWVCSDFREGQIGEVRFFLTWDETLESAGLSE
ncbi:MAG TPA: nuclear transport factor 2 family protein [Solirubrobacterales bacterium]